MSGRHRRPGRFGMWRAALRGAVDTVVGTAASTMSRLWRSRRAAQLAALHAEVIALRLTVAEMRDAVAAAETRASAAETRADSAGTALAELRELLTAPVQGPAALPPARPPATLELPLVRLALARSVGRSLTREMATALATPDRGSDTARTDIVLSDLPERLLLDPTIDRDRQLVDPAQAAGGPHPAAGTTRVA